MVTSGFVLRLTADATQDLQLLQRLGDINTRVAWDGRNDEFYAGGWNGQYSDLIRYDGKSMAPLGTWRVPYQPLALGHFGKRFYADQKYPYLRLSYLQVFEVNHAPNAMAGDDQSLQCTGLESAEVRLDAGASWDGDSRPGTNDDIVGWEWSENGAVLATEPTATASLGLGDHSVTLTVTDGSGVSATDALAVTVRDTLPPTGAITAPANGSCHGPADLPVVVQDNFVDQCEPQLTREYSPAGPEFNDHGDHAVTLTVRDASLNHAQASVSFTIDTVAPQVTLLEPAAPAPTPVRTPYSIPFQLLFASADDDGAAGGVVHEVIYLDDCALYDGAEWGDKDGLLSDEQLIINQPALCRAVSLCGTRTWTNPTLTVKAWDCGGNEGVAQRTIDGEYTAAPADCQ